MNVIFTAGHSNVPAGEFVDMLLRHSIDMVVDVRSSPYSKYAPHFSRDPLRDYLAGAGIGYEFMGDCLGGKPTKDDYLDQKGNPDYGKMAADRWFREGIDRLITLAGEHNICLMCSEEDPARCHRSGLLGPRIEAAGARVTHLRRNADAESQEAVARRVFSPADHQLDLFDGPPG